MSWTALRVVEAGVVLYDGHARRMAQAGTRIFELFRAFARDAQPGAYALRANGDALEIEVLPGSRLVEGMPARFAVSPYADARGPFEKPARPNRYSAVREESVATLLTSPDAREIWESCTASVVGWDGTQLVLVPEDRPRVISTAEACLAALPEARRGVLEVASSMPLVLVNAVGGACRITLGGRTPFPEQVASRISAALLATARRP